MFRIRDKVVLGAVSGALATTGLNNSDILLLFAFNYRLYIKYKIIFCFVVNVKMRNENRASLPLYEINLLCFVFYSSSAGGSAGQPGVI